MRQLLETLQSSELKIDTQFLARIIVLPKQLGRVDHDHCNGDGAIIKVGSVLRCR